MAVGIDKEKDDIVITFDFPDLSEREGREPKPETLKLLRGGRRLL